MRPKKIPSRSIYQLIGLDGRKEYDARDLLACIVDRGSMQEYKADFGKSLVATYAKIGGQAVESLRISGCVPNQKKQGFKSAGSFISDSADKAARFVMDCNQTALPIVLFRMFRGSWWDGTRNNPASSVAGQNWSMRSATVLCPKSRWWWAGRLARAITPCAARRLIPVSFLPGRMAGTPSWARIRRLKPCLPSCNAPKAAREGGIQRGFGAASQNREEKLSGADRYPIWGGARLGGCHYSTASDAGCFDRHVGTGGPQAARTPIPHRRVAGLTRSGARSFPFWPPFEISRSAVFLSAMSSGV